MHKYQLLNILKLAQQYYKLAHIKYGEIIEEQYISPEHEEYGDPERSPFRSKDPEDKIRESKLGNENLPKYEEFVKHYAKTKINYRLIYSNYSFGLRSSVYMDDPPTVEDYKSMIMRYVNIPSLSDEFILEVKQLLENFDQIFSKNAINVLVNKLDPDDKVTPEAVDHDIGHRFLETIDLHQFKFSNIREKFKEALNDEYEVQSFNIRDELNHQEETESVDSNNLEISPVILDNTKTIIINSLFKGIAATNIISTLITHNKIPNSISEFNLSQGLIEDLLPDLFVLYNKNGETFENLQFNGFPFITDNNLREISLNLNYDKFTEGYLFTPKNQNIPKINEVIKNYLDEIEKIIKSSILDLVGKVFILW